MTLDVATIRARLYPDAKTIVQVAYNAEATAAAFEVPKHRVWKLIQRGDLPARNTGKQYIVSGAVILAVQPHADVNDPNTVIDTQAAYYLRDVATLLGISYNAAQRLNRPDALVPDRQDGGRPLFYGRTILAYLRGTDEPLHYPESA